MTERSKFILTHMEAGNWLTGYATNTGLKRALEGMARRTTFKSKMNEAILDMEKDYEYYMADFLEFFPDVIAAANAYKKSLKGHF